MNGQTSTGRNKTNEALFQFIRSEFSGVIKVQVLSADDWELNLSDGKGQCSRKKASYFFTFSQKSIKIAAARRTWPNLWLNTTRSPATSSVRLFKRFFSSVFTFEWNFANAGTNTVFCSFHLVCIAHENYCNFHDPEKDGNICMLYGTIDRSLIESSQVINNAKLFHSPFTHHIHREKSLFKTGLDIHSAPHCTTKTITCPYGKHIECKPEDEKDLSWLYRARAFISNQRLFSLFCDQRRGRNYPYLVAEQQLFARQGYGCEAIMKKCDTPLSLKLLYACHGNKTIAIEEENLFKIRGGKIGCSFQFSCEEDLLWTDGKDQNGLQLFKIQFSTK